MMRPLDNYIQKQLNEHLVSIEGLLDADCLTIISPIVHGLETKVREALDQFTKKKSRIVIILDTGGGVVEVVERMVNAIRHYYSEVTFIIPDRAMSAGTIFAMSADTILMDYFSCLGPIDPQVMKDGKFVPANAYLIQYEELNKKATNGALTTAEYALLNKLDLAELHQFEQAKELSTELLKNWLSQYKFKNWTKTETSEKLVTEQMKKDRANEIALQLNDTERWHSHGRGISMDTLIQEINLKIDNYTSVKGLDKIVKEYFELLQDYMSRENIQLFVHTRTFCTY